MRETLTALAILLIVALTAALAGPYFVDWNANRGFLEAKLSRALGQKVTIGGAIDLKLLPTPYLVLNQAVIGGDDGPVRLGIRHLDLELSVAPLLHGAFEIVEAQLAEPTIRITLQRDRTLPPLPAAPAFDADVRFDRISLADGTLAIADPDTGRTFTLEHVDLQAEAESLAGPFHASGSAGEGEARTKFRFATAAPQKGKVHTKLVVDETPTHASLDLDGTTALSGAADASLSPIFEGTAAVAGHVSGPGIAPMPWRLSAPLRATLRDAQWSAGELSLGDDEGKLTLAASGDAQFGEVPALHVDLAGKQLDLDRLTRRAADGAVSPLSLADLLGLGRALRPPLPASVTVAVAAATYGDAAFGSINGAFVLGAAGASPLRLSFDAPGGSHLAVDGTADLGPHPSFSGHVALGAPDVPALRDWLGRVAPALSLASVPVRAADGKADVTADADALDLRGLALRLDRSTVSGSAHVTVASGYRPALVRADLQAAPLDLQTVPDLQALRVASAATDLDLHFEARGIKVARFGDGPLDAGHLRFALTKQAGHFALDAFRIEGFGGAAVDAAAAIDATGGHFDATLAAGGLADIAALARRVAPGAWTDALSSRAASLAPARLRLSAILPPLDSPGGLAPHRLTLAGTLGATKLEVAVSPDPADDSKVVATGSAGAPEGGVLLRQIGLPTLPVAALGPGRIAMEAKGSLDGALNATAQAAVGDSRFDLAGQLSLADGTAASGTGRFVSPDVSPLLQALAIAFPDLTGRLPANMKADVAWAPGGLALKDLQGDVGGDRLAGALTVRGTAKTSPSLTGALALDHLAIPTLASLVLGPPQPPGGGAAWSDASFGAGLIDPPASDLDLTIRELDLGHGLVATDAAVGLRLSAGALTLHGLKAKLAGGMLAADLALRRDGANAVLEGQVETTDAHVALSSLAGRLAGHLAFTGIGRTPLALASGLSGSGEARLQDLQFPRADPSALPKVFDDVEADRVSVDEDSMVRALDDAEGGPLLTGTRSFAISLAAGSLHAEPKLIAAPRADAEPKPDAAESNDRVRTDVSLTVDIGRTTLDARVAETLQALPKDWTGAPPALVIQVAGPFAAPTRTLDASALINGLAGRALARETARIEAYEADARERTFFNQRLQADRRREQDRVKAEDDARAAAEAARKAEAERRVREAAARLERARRAEEAARAAQERAGQDRAAQEHAAQDRAAQDRAAQDKAARDRAAARRQAPDPLPGPSSYQPSPAARDPSAADPQ